jgi:transaldolase
MYEELGIPRSRILVKIASTYEGILAGKALEQEGIHCNLTLLFSLTQAAMCAESGITLISPFVGRILDWYKAKTGLAYTPDNDPGVMSVKRIYHYFKKYGYNTIVMAASFRSIGEVLALAGCDRLTIAPTLLEELQNSTSQVITVLDKSDTNNECTDEKITLDESTFRFLMNEDAMASDKLSEGIRLFSADLVKLENIVKDKIAKV